MTNPLRERLQHLADAGADGIELTRPELTDRRRHLTRVGEPAMGATGLRDDLCGRRPRGSRRWMAVGAAAATLAGAASAVVLTVDSNERVDAATVRTALANLSDALEGSGRAEVHETLRWVTPDSDAEGGAYDAVWEVAFSGDDSEVIYDSGMIRRFVDGETYTGDTTDDLWIHTPDEAMVEVARDAGFRELPPNLDPQTLLDELSPAGSFELVGNEEVDGVPTRRLRATNPAAVPTLSFGNSVHVQATVTALEVWVDDEDLVRHLDLTLDVPGYESRSDDVEGWPDSTNTYSIRFFDLGAPITIETPGDYVEPGANSGG